MVGGYANGSGGRCVVNTHPAGWVTGLALGLAVLMSATGAAAQAARVGTEAAFLEAVGGRDLVRFGVRLTVGRDGAIAGNGFGRRVTGTWRWEDGFFCRTLDWGSGGRGENCQLVALSDGRVIFVADRGEGDRAEFRIE